MKQFKKIILVIFIAALFGTYYGVLSKNNEERGLASPQTELEDIFSKRSSTVDRGVISITSVEGKDFCELINELDEYKVFLIAKGVTSGDIEIGLSFEGKCISQRKLIIFDSAICNKTYKEFKDGFLGSNDVEFQGYDMDMSIPMNKLTFFISSLSVTYNDGRKETVEPSLDEVEMSYSCEDSFSL